MTVRHGGKHSELGRAWRGCRDSVHGSHRLQEPHRVDIECPIKTLHSLALNTA